MKKYLVLFVILLFSSQAIADWSRYKYKTIFNTIYKHKKDIDILGSDYTYIPDYPQLVHAKYTGEVRELPKEREKIIFGWLKMLGKPPELSKLFKKEIKIIENGREYWVSPQAPLIPHMEKELVPGDDFWLYTAWVGATKNEWVFVINEFKKAIKKSP